MFSNGYAFKQAWLSLKKRPGFIATVVATMGTTLGALTCILTLAYLLIFEPLPYPEQGRIYNVDYTKTNALGDQEHKVYNFPSLLHLYEKHEVFEQAAIAYYTQNVVTSLPEHPTTPVAFISPEYMEVFNVPMALGRTFDDREALNTEHQVAVINYQLWQDKYYGDADILSKKLTFKGRSYKIIGVTAQSFVEPQIHRQGINTSIWFPWDFHLNKKSEKKLNWSYNIIYFFAKLPEGYSAEKAEQHITPMMDNLWRSDIESEGHKVLWSVEMQLTKISEEILGNSGNVIYLLLAGVFGLVLIACANITNLFVSRTAEQQSTLATHAALGAKKSDLKRTIFTEAGLLMFASLFVALIIAASGFNVLKAFLGDLLPRVEELKINGVSVMIAFTFSLLSAMLFAFISSKMVNYSQLNLQLQSSGKGTGVQVSKTIRQVLIISQVAIATVLVFANVSLFKSAIEKINTPTGLILNNVYHTSFSVASPVFPKGDVVQPIMNELKEQLKLLPQVEKVDISWSPLSEASVNTEMDVRTDREVTMRDRGVGKEYFSMVGQTFIEGSMFSSADYIHEHSDEAIHPVILNEALANELFPQTRAVDQTLIFGNTTVRIVGVVSNTFWPGSTEVENQIYHPVKPNVTKMNITVKAGHSLSDAEVVEAIKATTSLYSLYGLESLNTTQDKMLFSQYTTVITTAALAVITILLATIGLYGILSYGTQMRRFELGTRMAIGAKGRDLIWLVLKENSVVIGLGVIVSSVAILLIYNVFYLSVNAYVSVALLPVFMVTLFIIATLSLFACYWPLRQYIKQPAIYSLRGSN